MNGEGVGALFERLSAVDHEGAALVNPADATRVRRAFEIFMTTGLSIAEWFKRPMVKNCRKRVFWQSGCCRKKPCSTAAAICVLTL